MTLANLRKEDRMENVTEEEIATLWRAARPGAQL